MRTITVTEKYKAVNEGRMAKSEFVRRMRQEYPMYISNFDGFDSTVQILKNKQMLFEAKKSEAKAPVYDEKPALTYSLDALDRGIRIELNTMGIDMAAQTVKAEDYKQAENKAKGNLEKNATHYLDLMSGESNKVDKHDKEVEVKRGAGTVDAFNSMKKATLKEEAEVVDQDPPMSEDAKKALIGKVIGILKSKYDGTITNSIIKDFLDMHYQDLLDGADIETEFDNYIDANYEGPSDMREADDFLMSSGSIFVDSRATTIEHIGELSIPISNGIISKNDIIGDFYDLIPSSKSGRKSNDEITIFKNGGGAHLDLMIAKYLIEISNNRLKVLPKGRILLNQIIKELLI